MTNYISKKTVVIISISLAVVIVTGFSSRSVPAVLPVPFKGDGCPVTAKEFNSWFTSGSITLNGTVKPFKSEDFPDPSDSPPDCDFFKWSEQTFLWLTSPESSHVSKGATDRIFDSPAFYDVSPPDADGKRRFIPHEPGKIRVFSIRDAQTGPNKLPVTFEKNTGRMLEVKKAPVSARGLALITNKAGMQTEVASVTFDNSMKPVFKDNSGRVIENPRPLIRNRPDTRSIVHKFMIGGKYVYLDDEGNNIEVVTGQADGNDVLMSQHNSLVYYSISVNQTYAYSLTGVKNGSLEIGNNSTFPAYASQNIIEYAAAHGKTIRYPEAATIEIKCSWVEAASLPDASKYIKMKAVIPTYNKFANQWIPNGQHTVELAMVGMHIVGRVKWWPDMLWATFEHIDNVPNAAYSYLNILSSANNPFITVPQNTAGSWTFCADESTGPFNVARMHADGNKIVANSGSSIGPSNIIRWKPWGNGSSSTGTNLDLKTLNGSVRNMLIDGDVRKNYIQIGTTWKEGESPNLQDKGSLRLANSTMETYMQGTSNSPANGTTCFSCHTGSASDKLNYSHIYYSLKPLFKP